MAKLRVTPVTMASASPERHHAGGEDVAVLVDQALAVAEEHALALQARVEEVGVVLVALARARALWISMPVGLAEAGRLHGVAWMRSSRPIRIGVP